MPLSMKPLNRFLPLLLLIPLGGCPGGGGSGGGASDAAIASTVTATVPTPEAANVPPNRKVTATFNRAMDPATITTDTFKLADAGGLPVAGTVILDGLNHIATFTPAANLTHDTVFTATITTGAKDMAGTALPSDYVWHFTTGSTLDAAAPLVSSTIPSDAATDVLVNQQISVTFNEAMDSATITTATFTLTSPGPVTIAGTVTYVGNTATFTPAANLATFTTFTARITTGATDLAGQALASNHTWTFSAGVSADTQPPQVSSTTPADMTSGIALNQLVAVTFNEAMDPATVTTATFSLTALGLPPTTGTVSYDTTNHIATFRPTGNLDAFTLYTLEITTGARDLAGNALATPYSSIFTTGGSLDTTAPTVLSTIPAHITLNVSHNQVVTATFSEPLDSATITGNQFALTLPGGIPVAGAVTYSGNTASFTPAASLLPDTEYTATIGTEVKDLAGNALAADKVWAFATAP